MEVGGEVLPALPQDPVDQVEGALPVAEPVQDVGDAGEAVVETERCADRRRGGAVEEPALALVVPLGADRLQRVQDTGRAVGEAEAAAVGELGDVAGEEPVVALGGGRGEERLDHGVAAVGPVPGLHEGHRRRGGAHRHVPRDLRDRLVEELLRYVRELTGDDLRQVGGLAAVHHEQRGDRQEQGEAEAGQRVPVDVDAGAVRRGEEPGVGDDLPALFGDGRRGLEVEQGHRLLVGTDHDVEDVQVVEDDPAGVHRRHGPLHRRVDPHRPRRVGGHRLRIGIRGEQRMPLGEEGVEGSPLQEVHDEEPVVTEREPVPHLRHHAGPRHLLQGVLLPLEPCDRVGSVGGQARVWPPLLQDDLAAVADVGARVDAAAVGEVQCLLDPVGQLAHRRGVPGGQMRLEELRQRHPLRHLEGGCPAVRHQPPLAVAYRRHERAALVDDEGAREGAVADVQRTVVPAQVGQDVRPLEALQELAQLAQHLVQLLLVGRVEGDELAAAVTARVLGVAQVQQVRARHELERDAAGHAVVPHDRGDLLRVRPGGRGVDLPALGRTGGRRAVLGERRQRQPVADPGRAPALGHLAARRLVQRHRLAARHGQPVRRLVEVSVGECVHLVALVHASPSVEPPPSFPVGARPRTVTTVTRSPCGTHA